MKRILVCGGRDYRDAHRLGQVLDAVRRKHGAFLLVHGACPTGADALAVKWAQQHRLDQEAHPAEWERYGRSAGPIRNRLMAESGLDGAVVFPGGRGTDDMRRQLETVGVSFWEPLKEDQ